MKWLGKLINMSIVSWRCDGIKKIKHFIIGLLLNNLTRPISLSLDGWIIEDYFTRLRMGGQRMSVSFSLVEKKKALVANRPLALGSAEGCGLHFLHFYPSFPRFILPPLSTPSCPINIPAILLTEVFELVPLVKEFSLGKDLPTMMKKTWQQSKSQSGWAFSGKSFSLWFSWSCLRCWWGCFMLLSLS